MSGWTDTELSRIGPADELEIASYRQDGTLRPYTTIWVVRVGDELYVRSWRGRSGVRCSITRAAFEPPASSVMSLSTSPTTASIPRFTRRTAANTPDTQTVMSDRWSSRTPLQPRSA